MKQRYRLLAIAAVSAWTLCLAGNSPDDAVVRIAVFEAMFAEQHDVQGLVLFVAVGDRGERHKGATSDPSEDILVRLRDRGWKAEPGSRAAPFDKVAGVKDAKTGHRGLWFYAGRVEWIGSSEALVYGESYRDGRSAEAARYRVVRQADTWKIMSRTSIWKS